MMNILRMGFFIPEVKNRAMNLSRLLNACFANIPPASFWVIQICRVIYKKHGMFQSKSS